MSETLTASRRASQRAITAQADCVSRTLGWLTELNGIARHSALASLIGDLGRDQTLFGPYVGFVLSESNVGTINQDAVTTVCASPKYFRAAAAS